MSRAFEWPPLDTVNHWSYSTTEREDVKLYNWKKLLFLIGVDRFALDYTFYTQIFISHNLYYVWTTI